MLAHFDLRGDFGGQRSTVPFDCQCFRWFLFLRFFGGWSYQTWLKQRFLTCLVLPRPTYLDLLLNDFGSLAEILTWSTPVAHSLHVRPLLLLHDSVSPRATVWRSWWFQSFDLLLWLVTQCADNSKRTSRWTIARPRIQNPSFIWLLQALFDAWFLKIGASRVSLNVVHMLWIHVFWLAWHQVLVENRGRFLRGWKSCDLLKLKLLL